MKKLPKKAPREDRVSPERRQQIGHRIRALRETTTTWDGYELAAAAGIDPATMSQIETGKRLPSLGSLYAICDQLGAQPGAVLDATVTNAKQSPDISSAVRAAVADALADFIATLGKTLGDQYEAHVSRKNGRAATGTAGKGGIPRGDRG